MITATKDRPIIFSGDMVRAIIDDRKTQTRRVVKPQPEESWTDVYGPRDGELTIVPYHENGPRSTWQTCWDDQGRCWMLWTDGSGQRMYVPNCPYGVPGDRMWVRETWGEISWHEVGQYTYGDGPKPNRNEVVYRAGPHPFDSDTPHGWTNECRWRPSIHMPRRVSRIALEITNVRVERVQEISEEDARSEGAWAEGVPSGRSTSEGDSEEVGSHRAGFAQLWNSINAKRGFGWQENPWVWVIEFKRVEGGG